MNAKAKNIKDVEVGMIVMSGTGQKIAIVAVVRRIRTTLQDILGESYRFENDEDVLVIGHFNP